MNWSTRLVRKVVFVATLLTLVSAVGIHAGTRIINQASMTYRDAGGDPHTATSNVVETVVRQVWGFVIKPDGTEPAPGQQEAGTPGDTVYFKYTVTNTGNGPDVIENLGVAQGAGDDFDFSQTTVYRDDNCDGKPDPGEPVVDSLALEADESACLVVAAVIPDTAAPGEYGNLNVSGTSQSDPALDPDGNGNAGDDNNWARAIATSGAALDLLKSASPVGYVSGGDVIAYTMQGANHGRGAAGNVTGVITLDGAPADGIFISDDIPAHTQYLPGSMTGSSDYGELTFVWRTTSGWTATEPAAAAVTAVGYLISGDGAFFSPDATFDLGFKVVVDSDITYADEVVNQANIEYDGNGDGLADDPQDPGDDAEAHGSNTTVHKVRPGYGVLVGPNDDADGDGNGFGESYTDPGGTTWTYAETPAANPGRNDDMQALTQPVVYTGETVYFRNSVQNAGNSPDSFRLGIDSAPAGWACRILNEDGATPISAPVGELAPGETSDFVVACTIPSGNEHAETDPTVFNDVVIRATSEGDPTQYNLTTDRVADVAPELNLDLADHGHSGDADPGDDDPAAHNSAPGAAIDYPLDVTNTGSRPDSYTLSEGLPSGWTVVYYADADCDGVTDQPEVQITETPELQPGERACYVARVTVAPSEQPGDFELDFTVTSKADPNLSDTVHTPVKIVVEVHLDIQKDVTPTKVQVGDRLEYTLVLVSHASVPLTTTVTDTPDPHLRYISGSASSNCQVDSPEPQVSAGKLVWTNLTMPAGEGVSCAIHYRMRVLPGAPNPVPNTVVAEGVGAGGLVRDSGHSRTMVAMVAGVFQKRRGTLIGRVYLDLDEDGSYTPGKDVPVPGSRLILENGRQVLSDGEGRYAFRDVAVGVWQVMLDDPCGCSYTPAEHPETIDGKGFRHRVRVEGLTVSDFPLTVPDGRIAAVRKTSLDFEFLHIDKELLALGGVTRVVLRLRSEKPLPPATLVDPLPGGGAKTFDISGFNGEKTLTYDLSGEVWLTDPTVNWRAQ